jgi:hypothetical protein
MTLRRSGEKPREPDAARLQHSFAASGFKVLG